MVGSRQKDRWCWRHSEDGVESSENFHASDNTVVAVVETDSVAADFVAGWLRRPAHEVAPADWAGWRAPENPKVSVRGKNRRSRFVFSQIQCHWKIAADVCRGWFQLDATVSNS